MRNHDVILWVEYAAVLPVLEVADEAVSKVGWTDEDWEWYGEQIGEIGSERALAGMRDTAMSDARRIWDFQRKQSALRHYAEVAPMMRNACEVVGAWLWI